MKLYMIVDMTHFTTSDNEVTVVVSDETREGAFKKLGDVAEIGHTYQEVKLLGQPIVPKERVAVTLSRTPLTPKKDAPAGGDTTPAE